MARFWHFWEGRKGICLAMETDVDTDCIGTGVFGPWLGLSST